MMTDLRFAFRLLAKSPVVTLIALATLALGIGANTSIFSVINSVLLRPLPLKDSEQLVQVWETKQFPPGFRGTASAANLRDWREQNTVFTGIAAYRYQGFALQGKENPERLAGALVSANYFSVLGTKPLLGRTFVEHEDEADRSTVVVISEALWRARFGADPQLIGRTISLDSRPFTVIGVMPASFRFLNGTTQVWAPLVLTPQELAVRGDHDLFVIARIRSGVTLAQARAQMNIIAEGLALRFPDEQAFRGILLVPLREQLTINRRTSLLVLFSAVGCVLLIATANVANLLLARTASRLREVALRLALGASRGRLIRQFLTESVLLALIGGALGILTALWGTRVLVAMLGDRIVGAGEVHLDLNVTLFAALISLLVGIACGLAPARQAVGRSAADLQTQLHGHAAVAGANRMRSILVMAEVAIAVVLLCGAGLLLRSFARLQRTESGLAKPEQVLTARVTLPSERYNTLPAVSEFYRRVLEGVGTSPGVNSAGAISYLPLAQYGWNTDLELEGRSLFPPGKSPIVEMRAIAGDYFAAVGVPLLAGRLLDARDGSDAPRALVINRTLAVLIAENEMEALGQKIKVEDRPFTIVGVVGDVRQSGLDRTPMPEMYFPVTQAPGGPGGQMGQTMSLVARAAGDSPVSLGETLRRCVREIDSGLPLFKMQTLQDVITESITQPRMNGILLGCFAAVALALAAIGLYGVLSYAVTQRTRELGIRLALGAQRSDIFRLIVGGGMKIVGIGIVIGLLAAFIFTRLLATLLYGVGPTDPVTFGFVVMVLAAVALLANYLPAHRAMRVNPTVALRYE
ncbi:MAG: ABC transporter permease [Chthoniobacterales bacterium]